MTRLLKNISAIVAVAMIIAAVAIPTFALVEELEYLDSSCRYIADDLRPKIYMEFSYWGGDGSNVYYFCCIETNTHDEWHKSEVVSDPSKTVTSDILEYNRTSMPFTYYCDGYACYD